MDILRYFAWIFLCSVTVNGECALGGGDGYIQISNKWNYTISSPGYGSSSYPANQDCSWVIKVPSGNRIQLNFEEFDIEDGEIIGSAADKLICRDYLQVFDSDGDEMLDKQCGKKKPPSLETSGNEVRVTFHTDQSNGFRGFKLQYEGICRNKVKLADKVPWVLKIPPITTSSVRCRWEVTTDPVYRPRVWFPFAPSFLPICNMSTFKVIDGNETDVLCDEKSEVIGKTPNLTLLYYIDALDPTNTARFEFSTIELAHCVNETCLNGGTCLDTPSSTAYTCLCTPNFRGKRCEEVVDACASTPCINGTCIGQTDGGFNCMCFDGITGDLCDTDINECIADPCANDGKCQNTYGDFNCNCREGFIGRFCGDMLDPCLPNKCQNNGTCIPSSTNYSYKCECQEGYYGGMCLNIDFCVSDPCQNGGTCVTDLNRYMCVCVEGFDGNNCEINVNECISAPCEHDAKCVDGLNHFTCECHSDYMGILCSDYKYKDMAHCPEETDVNVVSGLHWFHSRVGEVRSRPCPPGITGFATRLCKEDSRSETRGVWGRPDLTECVNPLFLEIANKTKDLLSIGTITKDGWNEVTTALINFTRTDNLASSNKLYPGDITVASKTMKMMSDLVIHLNAKSVDVQETAQGYGEIVGNLVDENTSPVWKITQRSVALQNAVSLLNSTEQFVSNLMQTAARIRRRRRATAPEQRQIASEEFSLSTNNIDIQISSVERGFQEHSYSAYGLGQSSTMKIPLSLINKAKEYSKDNQVLMYRGRFNSLSHLLTSDDSYAGDINLTQGKLLWSDVIAGKFILTPDDIFQNLQEPIILTFTLKNTSSLDTTSQSCVFMNMSFSGLSNIWSTEGCTLKLSNETHAECHCYHMTNFALLIDVYGEVEAIDGGNKEVLSYISYIGGGLSILVCILTIVVYEFLRLKSERIRIHQQLAAAIIGVQCLFLFGIDRTENRDGCKVVAILLHYFLLALFCWMLAEGIHIYIALVKVFKTSNHLKKYIGLGWGLPFLIVCLLAGIFHDKYGTGRVCWLGHEMMLEVFVPPVVIVILVNASVLVVVLRTIAKSVNFSGKMASDDRSSAKMALRAAMVLLPLLGLTWSFGFLSIDSSSTLIFTYLFTILNSGQGILFFIFHCLLNPDVQNAYERRQKWIKRTRKTSLTSSKSPGYDSDYNKTTLHTSLSSRSVGSGSYQNGNGHVPLHRSSVSVTFDDYDYPLFVESKGDVVSSKDIEKSEKEPNGPNGTQTIDPRSTDTKYPLSPKFSETF